MNSSNLLRSFNFLYFALLAMFVSFLPVYLDAQGLPATKIGLIIGTGGFIAIFSQPLWGMISDRTKTIKKVMLLLLGCSTIVGYLLYASSSFVVLLLFTMLMYFFLMPLDPLTESLNFQTAEANGVSYGSIRTFGAVGYAVMSLAVGYTTQYFGINSLAFLFAGIGIISILICLPLPDAPVTGKPISLKSLRNFLSNKETIWFMLLIFIVAVPQRINDTFLGVYIRKLGGTPDMVGLAWFLAAGSEILVFALSFWWLRKGKELAIISFAAVFYFIRFFLSAWVTDPHILVYLQLLQTFTFPIFYSAAIQYLYRIVPEEWRATGQTVLAILFFGVSGIVASYLGGWFYESFGGKQLYLWISGMSFAGLLFSFVLNTVYGKRKLVS
ncbi:MFS transporter [Paenibacillus sp. LMG 31458]|jgi:PPP family 3-phenylpropionic acid transporter|uniref:MFS transporter n=2 Tax=Paenibacillus TaxID=44249 RepID=A0ABX1ZB69_9BACL|nr:MULTISPECIES: MFS transporter [Paenibacillus]NOU75628.1 MFS transporter [Paenibacillus phytorum]NOU89168.1 MFS transporter [Paenibacillus germinis]